MKVDICRKRKFMKFVKRNGILIDGEDVDRASKYCWRIVSGSSLNPKVVTSFRTPNGVRQMTLARFLLFAHRKNEVVFFLGSNRMDFRKQNLFVGTCSQKQARLPKFKKSSTSKYKGVSFIKKRKVFRSSIKHNGITLNLGDFVNEEEAAAAYDIAAVLFFGLHAFLNFPDQCAETSSRVSLEMKTGA